MFDAVSYSLQTASSVWSPLPSSHHYLVLDRLDQMLDMGFEAQLPLTSVTGDKIQSVARNLTREVI